MYELDKKAIEALLAAELHKSCRSSKVLIIRRVELM